MLFLQHDLYAALVGMLVILFWGVLWSSGETIAAELDEALRLKRTNESLVESLAREKKDAEVARDLAHASARAKSAFVANIGHEIRSSLTALLGMAQLLERSALDRTQKNHVKVLLEGARGLKALLDDVIALSRDDNDGECESEEDCDPEHAARTVACLLQARAWEKQLRLTVSIAPNLPRVAASPRRVRQVLLKLADNALKFTQRGAIEIAVELAPSGQIDQSVRFSVTDTGSGIPSDIAPRIFEPLLSNEAGDGGKQERTAQGLAVAKSVITALGGQIGFESEPGEGSIFWFTLPTTRQAARNPIAVAGDSPPPWGLGILVYTRDQQVRDTLAQLLEPFGNRLQFSASSVEAASSAEHDSFDVIIADGCEADSIAVTPGVNAPLLALVQTGMRAPIAVHKQLHWPAGASALYGALREMLGRAAEAGAQTDEGAGVAAIDAAAFAALENSLGASTLIEILKSYVATAENLTQALKNSAEGQSWDDATRIAQDIASSAGGLGLAGLTAAARRFAQSAREGEPHAVLNEAAELVAAEHRRVCGALRTLYPELAIAA
jgi:signal transduction histidine kinase/HPt (histidine-containing phosphotransfer) domain-containing protein